MANRKGKCPHISPPKQNAHHPIRLTHPAAGNGRFGLMFWIFDCHRTADVIVMLYAGLSLNRFFERNEIRKPFLGILVLSDGDVADLLFREHKFEIVIHHDVFPAKT